MILRYRYYRVLIVAGIITALHLHLHAYHQFQLLIPLPPDLVDEDADAGPLPKRIANLDPANKFSFVHISKCAGSTWISLFTTFLKLNICPEHQTGPEHSVFYQRHFRCKDADYTLISLRSPRHHVWSQFTMCKYSPWGVSVTKDFPMSGEEREDDEADFDSWLFHFVSMGNETTNYYNCYHPANFQTRSLTSKQKYVHGGRGGFDPNITLAMNTYNNLDFVALVEFVHESQCMLYYRLGDKAPPAAISYLNKSCHCEKKRGLASLSAYGTICVDSGTVFAKSMTYCVMAGNWDFTRKAFPILSPEPFSAVKFTLPI